MYEQIADCRVFDCLVWVAQQAKAAQFLAYNETSKERLANALNALDRAYRNADGQSTKSVNRIAAAPELEEAVEHALAQLRDARAGYPESERHEPPDVTIARLEAALTKAGGAP